MRSRWRSVERFGFWFRLRARVILCFRKLETYQTFSVYTESFATCVSSGAVGAEWKPAFLSVDKIKSVVNAFILTCEATWSMLVFCDTTVEKGQVIVIIILFMQPGLWRAEGMGNTSPRLHYFA